MASREERRRRITDLYTVGQVLQVAPGEMVFIKKLNQFEDGEARADAQAARSRFTMALTTGPDLASMRDAVLRMDKPRLIDGIIASRYTKYMAEASTSLNSDKEWAEKLNVMDRTDIDAVREEEKKVVDDLNMEYLTELQRRVREREDLDRQLLDRDPDDVVQKAYEEAFVDSRSAAVYIGEYKLGQIAQAVRMCDATEPEGGQEWDHTRCAHERLYVDEDVKVGDDVRVRRAIEFVREEPDPLLNEYTRVLDAVHVGVGAAKSSASRQSSSAPSRPQSEEAESAASTQEEMSPAQAGTSA